ncbi:MAG: Tyrosine recombinase XerC [Anaerolineae bacterium]|nr:Tyrosine recombinase XerC [Anaerolineae bacterium]
MRRLFFELATQAGISDKFQLTPHTLRHFFATTFLRETGDLALTQDALGHADPRTTRIYASTDVAHLVDAHKRLFG